VGLLSVGAEAGKGNRLVKEASELIAASGLNFVGNIEGDDLLRDKAEVVISDGFVGNIVMKLTEGLGGATADHVRSRLNGKLPEDELERLTREVYEISNVVETLGGGPLLGVNGVSVVGHGRGKADSVRRAIGTARMAVEVGFVTSVNEELARVREKAGR
jgi:glycerol-3-phosphate acyltransferase PlsX